MCRHRFTERLYQSRSKALKDQLKMLILSLPEFQKEVVAVAEAAAAVAVAEVPAAVAAHQHRQVSSEEEMLVALFSLPYRVKRLLSQLCHACLLYFTASTKSSH